MANANEAMTQADCWSKLRQAGVGRVAVDVAGWPDVFPVSFVVDDETIVFTAGASTNVTSAVHGKHVALEIDGRERENRVVWSVVVNGVADDDCNTEAQCSTGNLPIHPGATDPERSHVRIAPTVVTGRRFAFVGGADLERPEKLREYHPGAPKLLPD